MTRIFKYPLQITDRQAVAMPAIRKALCVQVQGGVPCLWAQIDDVATCMASPTPLDVYVYGTGHNMPADPGRYVGTFQMVSGAVVFHVFVKGESEARP